MSSRMNTKGLGRHSDYILPQLSKPRTIRVLDISPPDPTNKGGGLLFGKIRIVDLFASPGPEYTALSYAWGKGKSSSESRIFLDDGSKSLNLTDNAFKALLALRGSVNRLTIWIDSICIDQRNAIEKTEQIALMGEIYSRADTTYIWLGEDDAATARAMKCMASVGLLDQFFNGPVQGPGARVSPDFWSATFFLWRCQFMQVWQAIRLWSSGQDSFRNWLRNDCNAFMASTGSVESATVSMGDLKKLLRNSWLYRVWTYQEVMLSENPVVVCGSHHLDWWRFAMSCLYLRMTERDFDEAHPKKSLFSALVLWRSLIMDRYKLQSSRRNPQGSSWEVRLDLQLYNDYLTDIADNFLLKVMAPFGPFMDANKSLHLTVPFVFSLLFYLSEKEQMIDQMSTGKILFLSLSLSTVIVFITTFDRFLSSRIWQNGIRPGILLGSPKSPDSRNMVSMLDDLGEWVFWSGQSLQTAVGLWLGLQEFVHPSYRWRLSIISLLIGVVFVSLFTIKRVSDPLVRGPRRSKPGDWQPRRWPEESDAETTIVSAIWNRRCQERKDLNFGTRNLLAELTGGRLPELDPSSPMAEIYRDLTVNLLRLTRSPEVILAGLRSDLADSPSWTVDWSQREPLRYEQSDFELQHSHFTDLTKEPLPLDSVRIESAAPQVLQMRAWTLGTVNAILEFRKVSDDYDATEHMDHSKNIENLRTLVTAELHSSDWERVAQFLEARGLDSKLLKHLKSNSSQHTQQILETLSSEEKVSSWLLYQRRLLRQAPRNSLYHSYAQFCNAMATECNNIRLVIVTGARATGSDSAQSQWPSNISIASCEDQNGGRRAKRVKLTREKKERTWICRVRVGDVVLQLSTMTEKAVVRWENHRLRFVDAIEAMGAPWSIKAWADGCNTSDMPFVAIDRYTLGPPTWPPAQPRDSDPHRPKSYWLFPGLKDFLILTAICMLLALVPLFLDRPPLILFETRYDTHIFVFIMMQPVCMATGQRMKWLLQRWNAWSRLS